MDSITEFKGEYSFLSNFAWVKIRVGDFTYPSVEHAYQASKTNSFVLKSYIRNCETPGHAKRAGRRVSPLIEDWDNKKVSIMEVLLSLKFGLEPFRTQLINTNDRELVEGNYWNDTFWGICKGVGENHLGKLLMDIRNELQLEHIIRRV